MINPQSLVNNKPPQASMSIDSKKQLEQMYITAKTDLEQKNYAAQYKTLMESRFLKNELNASARFSHYNSKLSLHYSTTQATDSYSRKKDGMIPLTVKQKFI